MDQRNEQTPETSTAPVRVQRVVGARVAGLHDTLATCHPSLSRGMVWCRHCGRSERVDTAGALRHGWPRCCGYTMTIDSPEEQARSAAMRAP